MAVEGGVLVVRVRDLAGGLPAALVDADSPQPPSSHGVPTSCSAFDTVLWSVSAAASRPAARIDSKASAGSPSPSL
jgi:hypothetical protein